MSNIFISSSFIYLASIEAGCSDAEGKVLEDCNVKVRGQTPSALVANIAVISGLLSAFLMPITGAMIDYTPYRKRVGLGAAFLITLIQAIQIGTVQSTWFPMSILQALAGFLYQVEVLATYAYLPDISRAVGQTVMTKCTSYGHRLLSDENISAYLFSFPIQLLRRLPCVSSDLRLRFLSSSPRYPSRPNWTISKQLRSVRVSTLFGSPLALSRDGNVYAVLE